VAAGCSMPVPTMTRPEAFLSTNPDARENKEVWTKMDLRILSLEY
jgi:hypothetical protein